MSQTVFNIYIQSGNGPIPEIQAHVKKEEPLPPARPWVEAISEIKTIDVLSELISRSGREFDDDPTRIFDDLTEILMSEARP